MITILEGADGCGKTTLAQSQAFADHLYQHQGPYTKDPMVETLARVKITPKPVLFDRLHLGERVYGPVYRNADMLGAVRQRMLERVLLSYETAVALMVPAYEDALRAWRERSERGEEMLTEEEHFRAVYEGFKELDTHLPMIVVNPFVETAEDIRDFLDQVRCPENLGPGIGSFTPGNVLIVGEQADLLDHDATPYPFVGGEQGTWVSQQLEDADIGEHHLYWVNALSPDGTTTKHQFVEYLQPDKVIALGKVAATWCRLAGFAYDEVPHPLYWMRFQENKSYPLIELLNAH